MYRFWKVKFYVLRMLKIPNPGETIVSKSLPDGHVCTGGENLIAMCLAHINGSYGFGIMGLDDGRVIANIVTESGPAGNVGMEVAMKFWNGTESPLRMP